MFSFYSTFERISVFFALFGNIILIYLITKKSVTKLGNYKYMMIYTSVFEIAFSILHGLTVPIIYTTDSMSFLVMGMEKTWFTKPILQVLNVVFYDMFGMSITLFVTHFIYRYMALSRKKVLRKYDKRVIISMIMISLLFGLVRGILIWYTMKPFPEADRILSEQFGASHGINLDQIAYIGVLIYTKNENGNDIVHWPSITRIGIETFFISISIILISIFGFKCYRRTRRQKLSQSTSTINIQSQLFYALVLQTLIPICLLHIPALLVYGVSAMNKSNELYGQFLSVFICLYPALDPLPNFFIIKSYRKAIKGCFKKLTQIIFCLRKPARISTVGSSQAWKISNVSSVHLS